MHLLNSKEHAHKGDSDLVLGESFGALDSGKYHGWIRYIEFLMHYSFKSTNLKETYSLPSNSWASYVSQQPTRSSIESLSY